MQHATLDMEHATRDARHAQSIMQRGLSETELPEADPETQADPETVLPNEHVVFVYFLLIFWIFN